MPSKPLNPSNPSELEKGGVGVLEAYNEIRQIKASNEICQIRRSWSEGEE